MGGCPGQISNVLQNLANEKIDDTELLEEVIYVFDNQNKTSDMDSGPGPTPLFRQCPKFGCFFFGRLPLALFSQENIIELPPLM